MDPNTIFCQVVAGIISRQPGISFREIKGRFPKVPSKKLRLAVRALVVAEQVQPETDPNGITSFFPKGPTQDDLEPKGVAFDEWLEQLKKMPDDTPFTLYFDFTLKRGWMRKNLERLGWSVNLSTGAWEPPPSKGERP